MGLVTAIFGWMLLNPWVRFPDGYQIHVDRDPPRFADPCDRNNILAFNMPTARALGGGVVALRYDSEHRPMGSGSASMMIRLRWKF